MNMIKQVKATAWETSDGNVFLNYILAVEHERNIEADNILKILYPDIPLISIGLIDKKRVIKDLLKKYNVKLKDRVYD